MGAADGLLQARSGLRPGDGGTARRPCTASRIRRSAWPPGCSTTTMRRPAGAAVARVFDRTRARRALTRDEILDNVTLYWLTNTGVSSRSSLLGIQGWLLRPQGRLHPGGRQRLSRTSTTRPRGAGRSGPTPTSSITTSSTRAATSPPGSSRSCSARSSGRRSAHCARRRRAMSSAVAPAFTATRRRLLGSAAMTMLAARLGRPGFGASTDPTKESMMHHEPDTPRYTAQRHRHRQPTIRPFQRRRAAGRSRRSAPAPRRDALAQQGARRRSVAGRAAGDDAGADAATGRPTTTGGRLEATLNALPQFTTEIDGVDIHFIHVKSPHENALPLIMTHGWPGSVIELLETVGPLTDPTAHGGRRRGRIPPGAAVPARLRLLGRAGRARLGLRPHRAGLGGADAAASATTATSPRAATWAPSSPT